MNDFANPGYAIDIVKLFFQAETVDKTYQKLKDFFASNYDRVYLHVFSRVDNPEAGSDVSDTTVDNGIISRTVANLLRDPEEVGYFFNHWARISQYRGSKIHDPINQFEIISDVLGKEDKYSSRSFFIVSQPDIDFEDQAVKTPAPCFCMGQFTRDEHDRLGITGVYRRQELSHWWIANIKELIHYQEKMRDLINKKYNLRLNLGPVTTIAISAWWAHRTPSMSQLPEFDDKKNINKIRLLAVEIFEDNSAGAATELVRLLRDKALTVGPHNAPIDGTKVLLELFEILESRFIKKNETLYNRISGKLSRIYDLSMVLAVPGAPENSEELLKKELRELADVLEGFASHIKSNG